MDKSLAFLVLLTNLLVLKCQEEGTTVSTEEPQSLTANPNYAFSYGVADASTGDVKVAWEEKDGDTVQGHYGVLESDGSMRTVDYSASPITGFQAIVNNDGDNVEQNTGDSRAMQDKTIREYGNIYDFAEPSEFDSYLPYDRKKTKHPFDTVFKDYVAKQKRKYPLGLDSSEFSHSVTIKHPHESGAHSESHAHFGLDLDSYCKHKIKTEVNSLYTNIGEDLRYPVLTPDPFKDNFEKYEPSNMEFDKINPLSLGKLPKMEPPGMNYDKFLSPYAISHLTALDGTKYKYPYTPDIPTPENLYPDDLLLKPNKKYRPLKTPEHQYSNEDHDKYWVLKKKKKIPLRYYKDYFPEAYADFDRPLFPYDDNDDRLSGPPKNKGPKNEVIKKIVKKKKRPGFNFLDILDI